MRSFLEHRGLKLMKGNGSGHEKWTHRDLDRPITLQNHINPVPQFIVSQILKHLGFTKEQFWKYIEEHL